VFVGRASAGHGPRARQQAFGGALEFEQAAGAIALAVVERGHQVRNLFGQALLPPVNLQADFEQPEGSRCLAFSVMFFQMPGSSEVRISA
jgi:hypothetical protein